MCLEMNITKISVIETKHTERFLCLKIDQKINSKWKR